MRCQGVYVDLGAVVSFFGFSVREKFSSWNLENVEFHMLLNTLELKLLVKQLIIKLSMGQRICRVMIVWNEIHGCLLHKIEIH